MRDVGIIWKLSCEGRPGFVHDDDSYTLAS